MKTFLSVQTLDSDGNISVLDKVNRKFNVVDSNVKDGIVKGQLESTFDRRTISRDELYNAVDPEYDDYYDEDEDKPKFRFRKFNSVRHAETYVLRCDVFWNISRPPLRHLPPEEHFMEHFDRALKNIYTNCMRGQGNTIVYHPDMLPVLEDMEQRLHNKLLEQLKEAAKLLIDPAAQQEEPELQKLSEHYNMIEHIDAPEDKVLVMYKGTDPADQPLIFIEDEGLLFNSVYAPYTHYGRYVKV